MNLIELPIEDTTEHTQAYLSEQADSVVDTQMPVLDGPFYDNGGINVSELQQTQTTELQQESQHSFYSTPPKSQPVNAESMQYPTISQSTDVYFTRSVQHEAYSRSPQDVYHP